jgi:predicted hydrocarbon binding protein
MVNPDEAVIINALVRQALVSAQEVMGENGLNAVLHSVGLNRFKRNFPPDDTQPGIKTVDYAKFNEAIESFYGRGGKGMLRRIGRASFQYSVREQGALMGLAGTALKLMPQKQRIKFVLNAMVTALKKTNAQVNAWVEEKADTIAYCESTCAICLGRHSSEPICHLYTGSVGEAVRWATDHEYEITETHCVAKGDEYCRFEVGEKRSEP